MDDSRVCVLVGGVIVYALMLWSAGLILDALVNHGVPGRRMPDAGRTVRIMSESDEPRASRSRRPGFKDG